MASNKKKKKMNTRIKKKENGKYTTKPTQKASGCSFVFHVEILQAGSDSFDTIYIISYSSIVRRNIIYYIQYA